MDLISAAVLSSVPDMVSLRLIGQQNSEILTLKKILILVLKNLINSYYSANSVTAVAGAHNIKKFETSQQKKVF